MTRKEIEILIAELDELAQQVGMRFIPDPDKLLALEWLKYEDKQAMDVWKPTCELRRYDNTYKLTDPRLQQKWERWADGIYRDAEWRDVPLVWEKPADTIDDQPW